MAPFPSSEVAQLLARCRETNLAASERGAALEDLVALTFREIPGVELGARNALSVFENEELDVAMRNLKDRDGLPSVGSTFLVECKNWSRPVGSIEICWFATKLRRAGLGFGVLVSTAGITGEHERLTAARFEVAAALAEGQQLVVLTLDELDWVRSGEQLAQLLLEKQSQLITRREVFIAERPLGAAPKVLQLQAILSTGREAIIREVVALEPAGGVIANAIRHFRQRLSAFEDSENGEPTLERGHDDSVFNTWAESNMQHFEALEKALLRVVRACVAALLARPSEQWDAERIVLGVEIRAPAQLHADPDSVLGRMLVDHWLGEVASERSYIADEAILCLLGLFAGWLDAVREGRWPPQCV